MEQPELYPRALIASATGMFVLFLVGGLFPPAAWGWQVTVPITIGPTPTAAGMAPAWPSAVVNLFVGVSTLVDYLMSQIAINRFVSVVIHREAFDFGSWSATSMRRWLLASLPCACTTILLAVFVPTLSELLGLITSLSIPLGVATFPAVALLAWAKRDGQRTLLEAGSRADAQDGQGTPDDAWLVITALLGCVLAVGVLAMTIHELDATSAASAYAFFCSMGR